MSRPRLTTLALALVAAATLTSACTSGITARSDYEPGTDFTAFRTYAWLNPHVLKSAEDHPLITPLLIDRIEQAVDGEMQAKGLELVDRDEADILLRKQLSVESKLRINDPYYSYDRFTEFEEGTLVIDFMDASDNRIVWRGIAQAKILNLKTPEERGKRIDTVVRKVMSRYPPKD